MFSSQRTVSAGIDEVIQRYNNRIAKGRALVQLCQRAEINYDELQDVLLARMLDTANRNIKDSYLYGEYDGARFAERLGAYLTLDVPSDFPRRVLLLWGPTEQYPVKMYVDFSTNQPIWLTKEKLEGEQRIMRHLLEHPTPTQLVGYASLVNINLNP